MLIRIVCVGKIKEKFYTDAVAEYLKRLGRYAKIAVEEVPDEKIPDRASHAEKQIVLRKEGARILGRIRDGDYVIALAIDGAAYDSEGFSKKIGSLQGSGKSAVSFVIGGSLGLDREVLARADEKLSFSAMTFPHQLMRVILLEQIYRGFRILNGEPYHK